MINADVRLSKHCQPRFRAILLYPANNASGARIPTHSYHCHRAKKKNECAGMSRLSRYASLAGCNPGTNSARGETAKAIGRTRGRSNARKYATPNTTIRGWIKAVTTNHRAADKYWLSSTFARANKIAGAESDLGLR